MLIEQANYGMRGYSDGTTWYPAVSSILDILAPLPAGWIEPSDLELGGALHRALFLLSKNMGAPRGHTTSAWPRVDAAISWLLANGYRVIEAETARIARAGYAGKPDGLIAKDGTFYVCDYKFAESLVERYYAQIELYRRLDFGYHRLKKQPQGLLVQITKSGEVKPKFVHSNAAHYAAGLAALNIIQWRINSGKW